MKRCLLQSLLLRSAGVLVPIDQRQEWLDEWHSELWYMRPEVALRACLGAFTDARALRKSSNAPHNALIYSAYGCLAACFAVGLAGLLAADLLLTPLATRATLWRLSPRDLLFGCILMLALSLVLMPLASPFGLTPDSRRRLPNKGRGRRILFFATKLISMQPILLCGLFVWIMTAPMIPFAGFGVIAVWFLVLRWVIADQQRRCPECLRLLDPSVRIGARSSILLESHIAESACPQAHGLLHQPESELSYPRTGRWVSLDPSWNSLFCTKPRSGSL